MKSIFVEVTSCATGSNVVSNFAVWDQNLDEDIFAWFLTTSSVS